MCCVSIFIFCLLSRPLFVCPPSMVSFKFTTLLWLVCWWFDVWSYLVLYDLHFILYVYHILLRFLKLLLSCSEFIIFVCLSFCFCMCIYHLLFFFLFILTNKDSVSNIIELIRFVFILCVCVFVIASNRGRKCDTLLSDRGCFENGDGPHPES